MRRLFGFAGCCLFLQERFSAPARDLRFRSARTRGIVAAHEYSRLESTTPISNCDSMVVSLFLRSVATPDGLGFQRELPTRAAWFGNLQDKKKLQRRFMTRFARRPPVSLHRAIGDGVTVGTLFRTTGHVFLPCFVWLRRNGIVGSRWGLYAS
jgi:hypothetical protein